MGEREGVLRAVDLQLSGLRVSNRRAAIDMVKVDLGGCDSVYRKVPPSGDFSLFSLFSLPRDHRELSFLDGGIQLEFYSEKMGLELICAGRLDDLGYTLTTEHSHRHLELSNRICTPMASSGATIPLYFKSNGVFSILAGQVAVSATAFAVRSHKVTPLLGVCGECEPMSATSDRGGSEHCIPAKLAPPTAPLDTSFGVDTDEDSESSLDVEQYESEGNNSVDLFIQEFTVRKPLSPPPPPPVREEVEPSATILPPVAPPHIASLRRSTATRTSIRSVLQTTKKKRPDTPHYMMPARTPTFAETLRHR